MGYRGGIKGGSEDEGRKLWCSGFLDTGLGPLNEDRVESAGRGGVCAGTRAWRGKGRGLGRMCG